MAGYDAAKLKAELTFDEGRRIHPGDPRLNMTKYRLSDIMRAAKCCKHGPGGSPQVVRRPVCHR